MPINGLDGLGSSPPSPDVREELPQPASNAPSRVDTMSSTSTDCDTYFDFFLGKWNRLIDWVSSFFYSTQPPEKDTPRKATTPDLKPEINYRLLSLSDADEKRLDLLISVFERSDPSLTKKWKQECTAFILRSHPLASRRLPASERSYSPSGADPSSRIFANDSANIQLKIDEYMVSKLEAQFKEETLSDIDLLTLLRRALQISPPWNGVIECFKRACPKVAMELSGVNGKIANLIALKEQERSEAMRRKTDKEKKITDLQKLRCSKTAALEVLTLLKEILQKHAVADPSYLQDAISRVQNAHPELFDCLITSDYFENGAKNGKEYGHPMFLPYYEVKRLRLWWDDLTTWNPDMETDWDKEVKKASLNFLSAIVKEGKGADILPSIDSRIKFLSKEK